MENKLEPPPFRADRGVHGVEDMRRRELVHRHRQALLGPAEKVLELGPAGFRADADRELHGFFDQRQVRGIQRLVRAGLWRRERHDLLARDQIFEGRRHRAPRSPERHGLRCGQPRHLLLDGRIRDDSRNAIFLPRSATATGRSPGGDGDDQGRLRRGVRRVFASWPNGGYVLTGPVSRGLRPAEWAQRPGARLEKRKSNSDRPYWLPLFGWMIDVKPSVVRQTWSLPTWSRTAGSPSVT